MCVVLQVSSSVIIFNCRYITCQRRLSPHLKLYRLLHPCPIFTLLFPNVLKMCKVIAQYVFYQSISSSLKENRLPDIPYTILTCLCCFINFHKHMPFLIIIGQWSGREMSVVVFFDSRILPYLLLISASSFFLPVFLPRVRSSGSWLSFSF